MTSSEWLLYRDTLPKGHVLKRAVLVEDATGDAEAMILRASDFGWVGRSSEQEPCMLFGDPDTLPMGHPGRELVPHSQLFVWEQRPCLVLGSSDLEVYGNGHVAELTRDFHRLAVDNLAALESRWQGFAADAEKAGPQAVAQWKADLAVMEAEPRVIDMRLTAQLRD